MCVFMQLQRRREGFSLLDVTVAVALLAVLIGLAIPRYLGYLTVRRLQNAAFLVMGDLRLAQQAAVAQSADGPRVEVCFRSNGYDIYAVQYVDRAARCDGAVESACLASQVRTIKVVNAGGAYAQGIVLNVQPAGRDCWIVPGNAQRFAVGFVSSGAPYPNDGTLRSVVISLGGRIYFVDLEPQTGLARVRQ